MAVGASRGLVRGLPSAVAELYAVVSAGYVTGYVVVAGAVVSRRARKLVFTGPAGGLPPPRSDRAGKGGFKGDLA